MHMKVSTNNESAFLISEKAGLILITLLLADSKKKVSIRHSLLRHYKD